MYGINVIETDTHHHVHIDISSFTLHDENNNIISLIKLHNWLHYWQAKRANDKRTVVSSNEINNEKLNDAEQYEWFMER